MSLRAEKQAADGGAFFPFQVVSFFSSAPPSPSAPLPLSLFFNNVGAATFSRRHEPQILVFFLAHFLRLAHGVIEYQPFASSAGISESVVRQLRWHFLCRARRAPSKAPLVGYLIDRYGPRPITVAAALCGEVTKFNRRWLLSYDSDAKLHASPCGYSSVCLHSRSANPISNPPLDKNHDGEHCDFTVIE